MEQLSEMKRSLDEVGRGGVDDGVDAMAGLVSDGVLQVRRDGRASNQLREIEIVQGLLKHADGSARVRMGTTVVTAAVFGPTECPPRLQRVEEANIVAYYRSTVPHAGAVTMEDKVGHMHTNLSSPCQGRTRESEITEYVKSMVCSSLYPRTSIVIALHVMNDDGSAEACCLNATSVALLDSGIEMRVFGAAVSVAQLSETLVVDPTRDEATKSTGLATISTDGSNRILFSNLSLTAPSPMSFSSLCPLAISACSKVRGIIRASVRRKEEFLHDKNQSKTGTKQQRMSLAAFQPT